MQGRSGLIVVDQDSVLSDGATPARFKAPLTTDTNHPNDVGYLAVSVLIEDAIRNLII